MAHIIKKGPIKVPTQPKDFDLQATGLVFKSYDNQIALEFNVLQQDGAPADLLGANLRLLMFIYDEVDGAIKKEPIPFITKNLITESFLNGHVVYILPEAMKAYNGMVEAYVYIEYPDGSTSDNLGFTFRMKRSTIDGLAQDKADYFIADFQQLLDGVKQEATDAVNEVLEHANQKITEYDQKFQQTAQNIATLDQNFTELRNDMKLSEAWAWSKDGTDRFTTVYPGENYVLKSKEPYTATGNGGSNQYPVSINNIPLNPDILGKQATIQYKLTISNYVSGNSVDLKMYDAVGIWSTHGGKLDI
ncbi:phage baseplate upper protein, partial [Enterococcus faecium]|uniref:phage baseplate upper protein n=1 Tax=Enterococcus faecium TaxID=1352 RepID=UPI00215D5AA7